MTTLAKDIERIMELDAKRTPGNWRFHNGRAQYFDYTTKNKEPDSPIVMINEWVAQFDGWRDLVDIGGDCGSLFNPEPYSGKGTSKDNYEFIASAPLMAQTIRFLIEILKVQHNALELSFGCMSSEYAEKMVKEALSLSAPLING